jgi:hypothetical protein
VLRVDQYDRVLGLQQGEDRPPGDAGALQSHLFDRRARPPIAQRPQIHRHGATGASLLLHRARGRGAPHTGDHCPLLHISAGTPLLLHVHDLPPACLHVGQVATPTREREIGGGCGWSTTLFPCVLTSQ